MENSQTPAPEIILTEATLPESPFALFQQWFTHAQAHSGFADPNAMCLSTVQSDGIPDSRMVLLKQFDERGFVFFTNSLSRKGRALAHNRNVALNFYWDPLHLQIRIQGEVEVVSDAESDAYFSSRSRMSQLGSAVSKQSELLSSRDELEAQVQQLEQSLQGAPVPRPPHWHGYRVVPTRIEFWKEGANRLHDRFAYTLGGSHWTIHRLYP